MSDFDPRELLTRALTNYNNSRERTQQTVIGPSSIGDCRRKVYHQIKGTLETNPNTEILAALMGTFIHTGIEKALEAEDPFGTEFLKEVEVFYNDMPGHVDLYIRKHKMVVDWKTSKLKNLKDFPSQQNIWQVQNYGMMLKARGEEVEKVAVVVIPRDGRMDQIGSWVGDYDEEQALKGQDWLDEIREIVDMGWKPPEPEKSLAFCPKYCPWFDPSATVGCPSNGRRF